MITRCQLSGNSVSGRILPARIIIRRFSSACIPRESSVRIVNPMVMFSRAETQSRPSSSPARLQIKPVAEAGSISPQPSGSRKANSSIGTARSRLPVIFCAMILT